MYSYFSKEINKLQKKLKSKESQLRTLKEAIISKYPEDLYGLTWMLHYDSKCKKLLKEISEIEHELIALSYLRHDIQEVIDNE